MAPVHEASSAAAASPHSLAQHPSPIPQPQDSGTSPCPPPQPKQLRTSPSSQGRNWKLREEKHLLKVTWLGRGSWAHSRVCPTTPHALSTHSLHICVHSHPSPAMWVMQTPFSLFYRRGSSGKRADGTVLSLADGKGQSAQPSPGAPPARDPVSGRKHLSSGPPLNLATLPRGSISLLTQSYPHKQGN